MKLKASKCEFAKEEIKFLGFILSKEGIRPNPEKTRAFDQYSQPTNATEVKSFLGMCSFFRRFIHNFATIAPPLTALTKKNVLFDWTPQCKEAMDRLKKHTTAPVLAAPRLGRPFIIETDSSAKGVAGILKQEQDGLERVIAYASRTLNKHEARYPAIELEALGTQGISLGFLLAPPSRLSGAAHAAPGEVWLVFPGHPRYVLHPNQKVPKWDEEEQQDRDAQKPRSWDDEEQQSRNVQKNW
ncbi:unnamed protein product [Cylicocyclus nassatus]|uniref:RNA-directed DNA polymerase n=1 Tax=Cylicocyclus nassatus TaxID=53992 RepID=A0AA36GTY6_CYLNA|nr:unnamed protein product [Cylicocyclus nassatus]